MFPKKAKNNLRISNLFFDVSTIGAILSDPISTKPAISDNNSSSNNYPKVQKQNYFNFPSLINKTKYN
jgi:hypothetical protein